ncbi:MAG: sensor histidine kinase [Rhodovarius sp.]|nr:sensor histidine kinase [Rhodovarius sp.]MCX7931185.1 sensor histidine kinase [Rhodovarius sp.]MDW8313421.1 sensor histidine kinase [Rhodovarius sp.]
MSASAGRIAVSGSLTRRLALTVAAWVAIGLGITGWFVLRLAAEQIEAAADQRMVSLLDAVIAAAELDPVRGPILARPVSEPEFERPLSGYYWQMTGPDGTVNTSRSLWDQRLPPARPDRPPRNEDIIGPRQEPLRLIERHVELESRTGRPPRFQTVTVQVAVTRVPTDEEIERLTRGLVLAFLGLGAALVAAVALLVVWALSPLKRTQEEIAEVRAGLREHVDVTAPAELAPLVQEIEALIEQNRATLERARTHVGNLAHALKTPVAVLRNALEREDLAGARAQAATLERLIQHHLRRARAGALAGAAGSEASPMAAASTLAQALKRLFASRGLDVTARGPEGARIRADPQDLTEMLGNLMENACKWAKSRVEVRVRPSRPGMIAIEVEDDGPGLAEGQDAAALARGVRLDEAAPGSGLGLAIVVDLAALYGGTLQLERGQRLKGLLARLELPGRILPGG